MFRFSLSWSMVRTSFTHSAFCTCFAPCRSPLTATVYAADRRSVTTTPSLLPARGTQSKAPRFSVLPRRPAQNKRFLVSAVQVIPGQEPAAPTSPLPPW